MLPSNLRDLFRSARVRYWHKADIRGTATFCPLLSESGQTRAQLDCPLSAMYGRRLRCKGKIWHFSEAFGCSHVFGL
jgi:hypothetical protein